MRDRRTEKEMESEREKVGGGERERDRDRQTETETERETDRQRQADRQRQSQTERRDRRESGGEREREGEKGREERRGGGGGGGGQNEQNISLHVCLWAGKIDDNHVKAVSKPSPSTSQSESARPTIESQMQFICTAHPWHYCFRSHRGETGSTAAEDWFLFTEKGKKSIKIEFYPRVQSQNESAKFSKSCCLSPGRLSADEVLFSSNSGVGVAGDVGGGGGVNGNN